MASQDIGNLPETVYHLLLSRVKMLGKMRLNIGERSAGRTFLYRYRRKTHRHPRQLDSGKYGKINMRLLSSDDIIVDVNDLGLRGLANEQVMKKSANRTGMILQYRSDGIRKDDDPYPSSRRSNGAGTKIITIEDPIEFPPGIVQTEVAKDRSYTFATALRAIVRQDPDIVLSVKSRDDENR